METEWTADKSCCKIFTVRSIGSWEYRVSTTDNKGSLYGSSWQAGPLRQTARASRSGEAVRCTALYDGLVRRDTKVVKNTAKRSDGLTMDKKQFPLEGADLQR